MRSHLSERLFAALCMGALLAPPWLARADGPKAAVPAPGSAPGSAPGPEPESADTKLAREEFIKGSELTKKAQWAEALASFERAAKLRPHAVTTYNIGACERALGRYTRARATLRRALSENEAAGGSQLSDSLIADTKGYLEQIEGLLSTAMVKLEPSTAAVAVDGRPLEVDTTAGNKPVVMVAGIRAPGPGAVPPANAFKLVLDPGVHVLTLSRKGYADAVVNRTFAPGASTTLELTLDELPATLHIASDQAGAVVTVNGVDVGIAPVDVTRPAGNYRVQVKKPDRVTYDTQVVAHAGESVTLRATLPEESHPITGRWWFWTGAAVVVSGVAVGTYFLTRKEPDPVRPAPNGGGLGWVVPLP